MGRVVGDGFRVIVVAVDAGVRAVDLVTRCLWPSLPDRTL